MREEIIRSLAHTSLLSRQGLLSNLSRITSDEEFRAVAGSGIAKIESLRLPRFNRLKLGLLFKDIFSKEESECPLSVQLPATLVGPLSMLYFLKEKQLLSLHIDMRYSLAAEILTGPAAHGADTSAPDLFVVSLMAAARILGIPQKIPYIPLMLLPPSSHGLVAKSHSSQSKVERGEFLLMFDTPGTASKYYQNLVSAKRIDKHHSKKIQMEPDEVYYALLHGDRDLRSVLWFPHYDLNRLYNDCHIIEPPRPELGSDPTVLFVRESVLLRPHFGERLVSALSHAWLSLNETSSVLDSYIDLICGDKIFFSTLFRSAGLQHRRAANFDESKQAANT